MVEIKKKKGAGTKLLSKLKNMLFTSEMRQVFTEENSLSFRFSALTKNPLRQLIRFCLYTSLRIIIFPTKDASSGVQKIEGPLWKVPRC